MAGMVARAGTMAVGATVAGPAGRVVLAMPVVLVAVMAGAAGAAAATAVTAVLAVKAVAAVTVVSADTYRSHCPIR